MRNWDELDGRAAASRRQDVRGPRVGLIASLLILPIPAADKAPPRLVGSPWAAVAGDTGAVVLIAAGGNRSCAVTAAGAAYCWGGEGGSLLRRFAAQVSWHIIALAPNRGCGIDTGGRTYCWGTTPDGQLGPPLTAWIIRLRWRSTACRSF